MLRGSSAVLSKKKNKANGGGGGKKNVMRTINFTLWRLGRYVGIGEANVGIDWCEKMRKFVFFSSSLARLVCVYVCKVMAMK